LDEQLDRIVCCFVLGRLGAVAQELDKRATSDLKIKLRRAGISIEINKVINEITTIISIKVKAWRLAVTIIGLHFVFAFLEQEADQHDEDDGAAEGHEHVAHE